MARINSQLIANNFAVPRILNPVGESAGRVKIKTARFIRGAAEGAGVFYSLFLLNAHDHLLDLQYKCTANTGATDLNIGLFTVSNSLTVDPVAIDDNCLADQLNLSALTSVWTSCLGFGLGSAALFLDEGKALWEYAQIATEPIIGTEYEVVATGVSDPTDELDSYCFRASYVSRGD